MNQDLLTAFTEILVEDFEQTRSLRRWEPTDDQAWRLAMDGDRAVYAQYKMSDYQPPVRSPHNISLLKDVYVSDFVLDAWVRSTRDSGAHRDMCLFFGRQDPSHFYYVHLGSRADAHANSIFIVDGKDRVSIAETRTDGTKWDDDWHRVCLLRDAKSGKIDGFFDDVTKPIMTAVNHRFKSGKVGVGTFDDLGRFDDIRLCGTGN